MRKATINTISPFLGSAFYMLLGVLGALMFYLFSVILAKLAGKDISEYIGLVTVFVIILGAIMGLIIGHAYQYDSRSSEEKKEPEPQEINKDVLLNKLIASLNLIASDYETQISSLPDNIVVTDEIVLSFTSDTFYYFKSNNELEEMLSEDVFNKLSELDNCFEKMFDNRRIWSLEALKKNPGWIKTRDLAKEALTLMGRNVEPPERHSRYLLKDGECNKKLSMDTILKLLYSALDKRSGWEGVVNQFAQLVWDHDIDVSPEVEEVLDYLAYDLEYCEYLDPERANRAQAVSLIRNALRDLMKVGIDINTAYIKT